MTEFAPFLKFVAAIVQQAIFIFLLVGAVFALAAGLLLVFTSQTVFRILRRFRKLRTR